MGRGDDPSVGRRGFFREALSRAIGPLSDMLASRLPDPPREVHLLRPPGAVDESRFASTCERCGKCVEVCPAHAIFPLPGDLNETNAGTPVIDADVSACVICEGLRCTTVCPSGALVPLDGPAAVAMGLAEVYPTVCVRSSGESCRECVDKCPIGPAAIVFDDDGPPRVLAEGCVGCGVCQFHCPSNPKAIVVRPTSMI